MEILVTGGAGFIGSAVAAQLAEAGHGVRVLDALLPAVHPAGRAPEPAPGIEFVRGDVRDRAVVERVLHGVDAVCHQAAMVGLGLDLDDAPEYVGCNDLGTSVLLAAMARSGVGSLVLAGSMVVYGEGRYRCAEHGDVVPGPRRIADLDAGRFEPPCPHCGEPLVPGLVGEEAPADPRNVYAATKLAQEHLASAWARACGGRLLTLRYHNVYGPGMPRDTPYAGVASLFRSALARGEAPRVFEDGAQRRDFVHVADVASANLAALAAVGERPAGSARVFNVGSGTVHTVGEMAEALAEAHGGPRPLVTGEYRLGDVRHVTADSSRLRKELGWRPVVGFADGMAQFAAASLRPGP
ncbi:NAD-dependent epimerase/dehydratase family protein [Kitasatospora sp. GP82]|uniref:NAD-dependent epimerase/dehydratase family protein n=1 Tax=Kitasatospora sp. GP82 TaxID=3035089 RepID=UPI0024764C11|nr:NAD-dependent epimerase/dehydratase family protein [Kitasatospora sp. GP82]MDH6128872.1 dTDP-L-rhamnose 4-epimerase [Kitasatospora sp. GP82]